MDTAIINCAFEMKFSHANCMINLYSVANSCLMLGSFSDFPIVDSNNVRKHLLTGKTPCVKPVLEKLQACNFP